MSTPLPSRKPYPTDVSDDEWAVVSPYLTLMDEEAPQRRYPLREVFNALLWIVRAGAPWRLVPTNLPPLPTVYQQARRWVEAGCFEALVHDLRLLLRLAKGRAGQPSAASFDARVLQSSPESGARGATTGTSGARAPRSTRRWIRRTACWR
jgi:transposase